MRFQNTVYVCIKNKSKDEIGGSIENFNRVQTIYCITTPVINDTTLQAQGYNLNKTVKFITLDKINSENFYLEHDGKFYKVISDHIYKNRRVLAGEAQ